MTPVEGSSWLHREQAMYVELLKPLVLPPRYATPEYAKLPTEKLKELSLRYMTTFWQHAPEGRAPLIVGVAQTGKTFTAALLAKGIYYKHRLNVSWVNTPEEFLRFERMLFDERTAQRLTQLKFAPVLVLDDLAQLVPYPKAMGMALEVITHRFDHMAPTIVTANLDVGKSPAKVFDQHFGVSMSRRLMEASEGFRLLTG